MPDKEGSDDEKTTKDVVNKKQKQMMNKEEYISELSPSTLGSYVKKAAVDQRLRQNAIEKLPKVQANVQRKKIARRQQGIAKAVDKLVKKASKGASNGGRIRGASYDDAQTFSQENYIPEEGYDIARDMGRVPKTKDKRDASSYPVSKEVRNMKGDTPMQKEFKKKYGKKATALDAVKQKYKGQMMNVKKEELDLTKVAEAFGGYIIEAKKSGDNNKKNVEPEFQGIEKIPVTKKEPVRVSDPNFQKLLDRIYGTKTSSQIDTEILKARTPTDIAARELAQKRKTDLPIVKKVLKKTAKKAKVPDLFTNKTDKTVNTKGMQVDDDGNIILNPPDQTPEQKKRIKQTPEYQKAKKTGKTPLIDQDKFSTDTRTVDQDRVTRSSGDGRKAGRRGKTVTYKTPDKITSSKSKQKTPVYKISTTPLQGPKRARSKTATQNRVLQKIRVASRSVKRPVQRLVKPAPSVAAKSLTATAKGIKKNPFAALVGASLAKDTFFPAALPKPPTVQGGKVGRRTAG